VNAQIDHHATAGGDMTQCANCHTSIDPKNDCFACHDASYWAVDARTDHHSSPTAATGACASCHVSLPVVNDCESCHTPTSWVADAREDHHSFATTQNVDCSICHTSIIMPAAGSAGCVECHSGNSADAHHVDVRNAYPQFNDCATCHTTIVPVVDCESCHLPDGWGTASTAQTAHHDLADVNGISCSQCHTSIQPAADCSSCHGDWWPVGAPNLHHESTISASYGFACLDCHALGLDPVTGSYGIQKPSPEQCETCHTVTIAQTTVPVLHHATPSYTANNCGACHSGIADIDPQSLECATCHAAQNKDGSPAMHHSAPAYLAGDCTSCHQGVAAAQLDCIACHADKPRNGSPQMHHLTATAAANNCAACHTGVAVGLDCASCHAGKARDGSTAMHHATPNAVAENCESCHVSTAQAKDNCALCHDGTVAAAGNNVTHHATANAATCATCHTGISQAELDCATCHSSQPALDGGVPMHHATAPAVANNCAACHQNVTLGGGCESCHASQPVKDGSPQMHHDAAPVLGITTCATCHTGTETVANNCALCHDGTIARDGSNTMHHGTAGAATCSSCHTGIDQAQLDCATCHSSNPKNLGLTGDVAMHHASPNFTGENCSACHDAATFAELNATGECASCHTTGANAITLAERHHSTAPAQTDDCAACHTIDQAELDCATCHNGRVLDGTASMHHDNPAYAAGSCVTCHSAIDAASIDCATCHSSQPVLDGGLAMHHATAQATSGDCMTCHVGADSALIDCAACHVDSANPTAIVGRHHNSTFAQTAACTDCHTAVDTAELDCALCHTRPGNPAVDTLHHDMTIAGQTGNCAACHAGTAVAAGDCALCHDGSSAPAGSSLTHHATPTYQTGLCSACHLGAEAAGIICADCHSSGNHHLESSQYAADNCTFCHTSITLNGGNCADCHASGGVTVAETHHATPLANVGGDCSTCHQSVSTPSTCSACHLSSPHHDTIQADNGMCEYCHTWPANANTYPKQLSCRQCHGDNQHGKNSSGPIVDYRICFDCHDAESNGRMMADYPNASPAIPFHASPGQSVGFASGSDALAPGRGSFNLFYDVWGGRSNNRRKFDNRSWRQYSTMYSNPMISYNLTQVSANGNAYTVPYFGDVQTPNLLEVCTNCHGDRSSLVACDNPQWTNHVSNGYVESGYYDLAESTYLGSKCSTNSSGGTDPLANCTSCHGDLSAQVSCSNQVWLDHLTLNRVSQSVYDLAEATYLGSSCGNNGGGTDPLASCLSCHGDFSAQVDCTNSKWTSHVTLGRTDQATYDLAEVTYLGSTCSTTPDPLAACTSCHTDYAPLVACDNPNWTNHVSVGRVSQSTYDQAELTYLGNTCGSGGGSGNNTVDVNGTYVEAEAYNVFGNNFSEQSDSSANGGTFLYATTNSTSSLSGSPLEYTLNFPESGTYCLWARGDSNASSGDNSIWYGIDGNYVGSITFPTDSYYNWANVPHSSYGPNPARISISSAGEHRVVFWAREDGFRFDGFYLSKSSSLPSGNIPSGATVVDPNDTSGGGTTPPPSSSHPFSWSDPREDHSRSIYEDLSADIIQCASCHDFDPDNNNDTMSCYRCHDEKWPHPYFSTTYRYDYHRSYVKENGTGNCVACHNVDDSNDRSRMSCYYCHDNKWDESSYYDWRR
jgi:hypothetical protein